MRYFTAVLGESHRTAATALVRSFHDHQPGGSLTVFTDVPGVFPNEVLTSWPELLEGRESFYDRPGRRNIFKLALFTEMFERYPDESIAWLDVDMLVLDELSRHIDPSRPSVIAHGKRDGEVVPLGDGLKVPGSRYAISGLFSLPNKTWIDRMNEVIAVRPSWNHMDHNSNLGDQLILNHVIAGVDPGAIHWITDDRSFVFNLEIADGLHPYVGDSGLNKLTLDGDSIYLEDRKVVLLYWIKKQLDLHLSDGLQTFKPEVRDFLLSAYRSSSPGI